MSSDTRSHAIECMAREISNQAGPEWSYELPTRSANWILDALEAAGFVVLAPGELQQVDNGNYVDFDLVDLAIKAGQLEEVRSTGVYVRTDGGDAS